MSVYITLTGNQNRPKPGGKICIYINITINKKNYSNKHLISFYEMFSWPETTQLQDTLFQVLIIFLKTSKFSEDFTWCGRKFHILGPKLLRLLVP